MKATGIVRRIDDLGRVVIPKEIRRTMRIREGDPTLKIWENWMIFSICILRFGERIGLRQYILTKEMTLTVRIRVGWWGTSAEIKSG